MSGRKNTRTKRQIRKDADCNIACAYARAQKPKESMNWLKTALDKGNNNWRRIRWDEDLDPIRSTPAFKTLMKTYFPHPDQKG